MHTSSACMSCFLPYSRRKGVQAAAPHPDSGGAASPRTAPAACREAPAPTAAGDEGRSLAVPPATDGGVPHGTPEPGLACEQRRALVLISAGTFSALSIWFSASAILVPLAAAWDISGTEGSLLTSTVNIGFVVGCVALTATALADRAAPQALILAGSAGAAGANLALLLASDLTGALFARFFVGVFLSLVYPPGVKLLATWFSPQQRGAATGVMFGAFCLGSAFPQLLTGLVSGRSWRLVVAITSSASLLSGGALYMLVGAGPFRAPRTAPQLAKSGLDARACVSVLKNRQVLLATLAYCGHMWELFCVWAWCATFVRRSWHLSDSASPLVAFAVISSGGPGSWLGGALGDRFGRVRVAASSLAVSGSCVAVLGLLAHEGPLAVRIAIALVWGFSAIADSPQFSAIITIAADPDQVGTALTLQMTCGYLLTVLALWVMPAIAASVSWRWSFFSLAAGPLVSLTALLFLGRPAPAAAASGTGAGALAASAAVIGARA